MQNPIQSQAEGITVTFKTTMNGQATAGGIKEIVVVGGLAREHFEGVLAHEYGHVWLFRQGHDQLQDATSEGFCELLRCLWLAQLDTPLAREILKRQEANPDPVYGLGFRRFKAAWDLGGLPGVLRLLSG